MFKGQLVSVISVFFVLTSVFVSASTPNFAGNPAFGASYSSECASFGDFDADGDLDFIEGNYYNQPNEIYSNSGNPSYNLTYLVALGAGNTFPVVWGDVVNDGFLDCAVGNGGDYYAEDNSFFSYNGSIFSHTQQFGALKTTSMAWGDYDEDGDIDLAVGNFGTNAVYINNGHGTFTIGLSLLTFNTYCVAWADYDGDGDLDLAEGNHGQNYIYNNSGGVLTPIATLGASFTTTLAWGDYDNDGDLDVAEGVYNGMNILWTNTGSGSFTQSNLFNNGPTTTVAWADYDNDGDIDLAVGVDELAAAPTQNYLYENSGSPNYTFTQHSEFGVHITESVAWGDFDNDFDLDLGVANSGQNYLYVNNENDNNMIIAKLEGQYHAFGNSYSNRDGIGAKVVAYEAGFAGDPGYLLGYWEVDANGGWCGQDSIDVEFGIPNDATVDIVVEWAGSGGSNIVESFVGLARGQKHLLIEGSGGPVGIDDGDSGNPASPTAFTLNAAYPNPSSGSVTFSFALPETADVALVLFDVKGRKIETIVSEKLAKGKHERSISNLASGIYLYRLEADDSAVTKKIIVK